MQGFQDICASLKTLTDKAKIMNREMAGTTQAKYEQVLAS